MAKILKTQRQTRFFTGYILFPSNKQICSKHPTQKPVELMEYLIKTYTNEGEIVLDFTMGRGTTGIAARNTGRKFIGIEITEKYYGMAEEELD